ncbi:MAG: hypothetical protein KIT84_39350 [Labilithrix sp.]|nr:hypothetical protein [Labilithrix sp.]MCW5817119.1 hypothetical protein [Labilithrix sp.]
MKRLRLLAGALLAGAGAVLAGCATTAGDESASPAAVNVDDDGLVTLPSEAAATVKATAGLDATRGRPIYEPDGDAPAYFEIATASGWAVVTASGPARVVEYGTTGRSPSARLELGVRSAMTRVYRLDAAVYVAADGLGNALGRSTRSLLRIDRSGEEATFVPVSTEEAMRTWRAARTELLEAHVKNAKSLRTQDSPLFGGTAPERTCMVKGEVPSYDQLSPGEGPNTTACMSGCGPTAWATLFGWGSRRAAADPANDGAFAGLLPNAPLAMNADVSNLMMQINRVVRTSCIEGQGMTTPWAMGDVGGFITARAPGVTFDARYNFLMIADNGVRDAMLDALCDGRPAIVGTGSLFGGDGHYPIAKGYSNGRFELEMGWGGDGNGWYDANTWYSAALRH